MAVFNRDIPKRRQGPPIDLPSGMPTFTPRSPSRDKSKLGFRVWDVPKYMYVGRTTRCYAKLQYQSPNPDSEKWLPLESTWLPVLDWGIHILELHPPATLSLPLLDSLFLEPKYILSDPKHGPDFFAQPP